MIQIAHVAAELRRLADALCGGGPADALQELASVRSPAAGQRRSATVAGNLDRVTGFARELAEVVAHEVQAAIDVPPERAAEIGLRCAQRACDEFAGQILYVPLGMALRISERDRTMYDIYRSNGRDVAAVAKEFGLSIQTAYKRIALVEAAEYCARQGALFNEP